MTAQSHRTRRRWVIGIAAVLTLIAVIWFADAYQRQRRVMAIKAAIEQAGGEVDLDWPAWRSAWERMQGLGDRVGTQVIFRGEGFNSDILQQVDDLSGLKVACLYVLDGSLSSEDTARLVTQHPVTFLHVIGVGDSDVVAAALTDSETLYHASFRDSGLTADGLRELPLERIRSLFIPGTGVTSPGLQVLRRCKHLSCLELDGRQLDDNAVEIVRSLTTLRALCLRGADVTDEHLQRVHPLGVEELYLEQTSATSDGIAALKQAMPHCTVIVQ